MRYHSAALGMTLILAEVGACVSSARILQVYSQQIQSVLGKGCSQSHFMNQR